MVPVIQFLLSWSLFCQTKFIYNCVPRLCNVKLTIISCCAETVNMDQKHRTREMSNSLDGGFRFVTKHALPLGALHLSSQDLTVFGRMFSCLVPTWFRRILCYGKEHLSSSLHSLRNRVTCHAMWTDPESHCRMYSIGLPLSPIVSGGGVHVESLFRSSHDWRRLWDSIVDTVNSAQFLFSFCVCFENVLNNSVHQF